MLTLSVYVGGFLSTIVMTMMILYGYTMKLMPPDWNMITDGLGATMNRMMSFVPISMGWLVHFMIGTIIHPIFYDLVWVDLLGINLGAYVNEVVYAMVFALMMISMLGMLRAPKEWRMQMAMGIIMAHIVYAVGLALFWPGRPFAF